MLFRKTKVIASKTALVLLLLVLVLVTAAHRARSANQVSGRLAESQFIAEGARLFATNCGNAYCHGSGGMGGGGPRLRGKGLETASVFKSISNGLPGTSMPSFKSELTEEQIWKLVAFVVSDTKTSAIVSGPTGGLRANPASTSPLKAAESIASAPLVGDSQAGKALFFDSSQPKSCHSCHALQGDGTSLGPDLSTAASRSARELFVSIIFTRDIKDPKYATITVSLRSGEKIVGVKKEEDAESLRVFDTTELPPVLRTVQKTDVGRVEYASESVMPKDYASAYTIKQVLDLVTFLKSFKSKSPVMLKDLLE